MGCLLSGSMVGLMATSSKRTNSTQIVSQVCWSQSPCPLAGHCWPVPLQETLKHSKVGLAQSLWGLRVLVHTRFCLSLPSVSGGYGVLILNMISPLLPSCWGFSFALGCGVSFFGGIQHYQGFLDSSVGKESACNSGSLSLIPGSRRSAGEGIGYPLQYSWASLVAQLVKNPPAMQETWVWSLGWDEHLEKRKATHSSTLALRIPWTV